MSMLAAQAFAASRFPAKNLLTNPDFSSGTSGWSLVSGLQQTISDNEMIITNLGNAGPHKVYRNTTPSPSENIKYLAVEMQTDSPQDGIRLGNTGYIQRHSGSGQYERLSLVGTGTNAIRILDSNRNGDISGSPVRLRRALLIDLTALFGAGNEPTREQMDELLMQFPNSWFKGVRNLFNAKHFMTMYFKKITELETAIAALGGS